MATKKPSGLGRGLGDMLEDNTPDIRSEHSSVTIRKEGESIRVTPAGSTEIKTKTLFETKPRNRSVKSNFKK
jgi:hypothetical protein